MWTRGFIGRHISVRWKLTLWYGGMCLLILGIVGLGMRQALHRQVNTSIDSNLRDSAVKIQQSLARSLVVPGSRASQAPNCKGIPAAVLQYCIQMQQDLNFHSQELVAPGQIQQLSFYVYPPQYPGQPPNSPPVHKTLTPNDRGQVPFGGLAKDTLLVSVGQSGKPQFTSTVVGGSILRTYLVALQPPKDMQKQGVFGALEIFQTTRTYNTIERTFDLILLLGIPLGLFVALVAGWWIARAALRPIERISRTVQAIGESRDLSRRLRFVGPNDEVGRLAETFDGMMGRLERAFETQKRFVADASHELRTPLTAIRGNADLMAIAPPEERELCLSAIRREAERMTRLVGDLLLLAEADVETQPLQLKSVDLDEILLEVHHSAIVLADGKVSVVLEHSDPVQLIVDPDRIQQLLLNLVENAVKFTPPGGIVTLSLRARETGVLMEVSDSGVGIPADAQWSIFERFYRVEEGRTTRGSGLGLAICAWIVAAHGGTISVRSHPGMGSTFAVWLPCAITDNRSSNHSDDTQTRARRLLN
jgi:two-component system, OmpR family, sensor kinase